MSDDTIIKRAFGLAASGSCRTVADLEKALKSEGYTQVSEHLSGPSLRMQLKKLMKRSPGEVEGNRVMIREDRTRA